MCIIVITHNNASTLRKALDSLVNSELIDEIIIVDNNSVDGSQLIIRKFMAEYTFVKGLFPVSYTHLTLPTNREV